MVVPLLRVIPPILLLAVDVPMKLLERVVAELLILPPLMSNVVGVSALRIYPGTTRFVGAKAPMLTAVAVRVPVMFALPETSRLFPFVEVSVPIPTH